ncbi:DUF4936 family protein [Undibacterium pigrum]|uniref:Uncharacterized protein DUF4936 n=1 Tax=Undibacterium pigrum TaxID=401470 RepID=A0A318JI76_9BURK|nr:DUF4936 family protein [Undibacterium pigrum]PXX46912.1 uncharacterized protein DUF4936 [Undibacterium pigrum]
MNCYIYFKASAGKEAEVLQQERLLQNLMRQENEKSPLLQRRPTEQDGMHTWMEIYHQVTSDFEQRLELAYAQTGLQQLQSGERHMEYFVDIDLCA